MQDPKRFSPEQGKESSNIKMRNNSTDEEQAGRPGNADTRGYGNEPRSHECRCGFSEEALCGTGPSKDLGKTAGEGNKQPSTNAPVVMGAPIPETGHLRVFWGLAGPTLSAIPIPLRPEQSTRFRLLRHPASSLILPGARLLVCSS